MAAGGTTRVVVAALGANALIAVSKFVAASITGSAAMLSEALHSVADTANQGLLLFGMRRARQPADARHPFGYSKELYFWSFVVAILLFSMGAGVSMYEGVQKLLHPHPIEYAIVNYIVLTVAICVELVSTWVAVGEFNAQRGETGALTALKCSKDPALFTVVLEGGAALIGLVIALAGNLVSDQLGWLAGGAVASIAIGCVLAGVSSFHEPGDHEPVDRRGGKHGGGGGCARADRGGGGEERRHSAHPHHSHHAPRATGCAGDRAHRLRGHGQRGAGGDHRGRPGRGHQSPLPEIHCSWRRKGIEASGRVRFEVVSRTFPDLYCPGLSMGWELSAPFRCIIGSLPNERLIAW